MSKLTPEVRVNKNGVPVIKHVNANKPVKHTGLLAKLIPAINNSYNAAVKKQHDDLVDSIRGDLEAEREHTNRKAREKIASETDPAVRMIMQYDYAESAYEYGSTGYKSKELQKYSVDTLERFHAKFHDTGRLTRFISNAPKAESDFRDALNFLEAGMPCAYASRVLADVRVATGIDDLSSIEPGTATHDSVAAVLKVAIGASNRRTSYDGSLRYPCMQSTGYDDTEETYYREKKMTQMTAELAAVIVDYPDRIDDIIEYIGTREGDPAQVDGGHLRLHLDNPTPALADGIL